MIPKKVLITVSLHHQVKSGGSIGRTVVSSGMEHLSNIIPTALISRNLTRPGRNSGFYQDNTEKMIREKTEEYLKINKELLDEIQKRKLTERSLQKLQFCINNSSEMILWADETGTITSSNKSALDMLGILPGTIVHFMRPGISTLQQPIPWQEIWKPGKTGRLLPV